MASPPLRWKEVATASSATVTKPTRTIQGDLMIARVAHDGTGTFSPPSGWTQIGSEWTQGSSKGRSWWKVHGDEATTTSYTFGTGGTTWDSLLVTFAGADVAQPIGAVGDWETSIATTTPSHASIDYQDRQSFCCALVLATSAVTFTPPTGYTEISDSGYTSSDYKDETGQSSSGVVQWTASGSADFVSMLIEIRKSPVTRRFYLPSSGAPAISPAYDGSWDRTNEADRILATDVRGSSALTNKTFRGSGSNPNNALNRQYLIGPLAAQTISGAIRLVARADENGTNANIRSQICVRAVAPDATTFRGTLLATETGAIVEEWSTTTTSRLFPPLVRTRNLTATAVADGDYLVVEVGGRYTSTSTSTADFVAFGENAATALDDSNSDTGADHPWVEFSNGLMLLGEARVPDVVMRRIE